MVGLGNSLMADDGFGEAVVGALLRRGLPQGMTAEIAPDVLGLLSVWRGQEAVWMVDAVALGESPGTIHRFEHDEIFGLQSGAGSAHHLSLVSNLQWMLHSHAGLRAVHFRLWGAEPATIAPGPYLSETVRAAVAQVALEIQSTASRPAAS